MPATVPSMEGDHSDGTSAIGSLIYSDHLIAAALLEIVYLVKTSYDICIYK